MKDSTNDPKVYENIVRHIMSEEGYRSRPYLDPNGKQWDIGYARTFFYGKDLPEQYKNMTVNEPDERRLLESNFKKHRDAAADWLENNGVKPSGRLLDQLGMLSYGSTFGEFRGLKRTRDALEDAKLGDEEPLSIAAARYGRSAGGKPMAVLAKRRDAERAFYQGGELPIRKIGRDAVMDGTSVSTRTPGLGRFRKQTPRMDMSQNISAQADMAYDVEKIMGRKGSQRANELSWKILKGDTPMPEGWEVNDWMQDVMVNGLQTEQPPPLELEGNVAVADAAPGWLKQFQPGEGDKYTGQSVSL